MIDVIQEWLFKLNPDQQSIILQIARGFSGDSPVAYRQLYLRCRQWVFDPNALGGGKDSPLTQFQLTITEMAGFTDEQVRFFLPILRLVATKHNDPFVMQQAMLVRTDLLEIQNERFENELKALRQSDSESGGMANLQRELGLAKQRITTLSIQLEEARAVQQKRDEEIAQRNQEILGLKSELAKDTKGLQIAMPPNPGFLANIIGNKQ